MEFERNGWSWPALPKREWGPRGWNWLHITAINYPLRPSLADARSNFRRIWSFVTHLPCIECRAHAVRFVLQNPPSLASTYTLQSWVWKFHNETNIRLGKPFISYEEYQRIYADELCWSNGCRTPLV